MCVWVGKGGGGGGGGGDLLASCECGLCGGWEKRWDFFKPAAERCLEAPGRLEEAVMILLI